MYEAADLGLGFSHYQAANWLQVETVQQWRKDIRLWFYIYLPTTMEVEYYKG